MNQALAPSLLATREPTLAVAVSELNPSLPPLGVPVSAVPFALMAAYPNQANRRAGRSDIRQPAYRTNAACPQRDAHPHRVGIPTRAATFPGTGLPPRRWSLGKLTYALWRWDERTKA